MQIFKCHSAGLIALLSTTIVSAGYAPNAYAANYTGSLNPTLIGGGNSSQCFFNFSGTIVGTTDDDGSNNDQYRDLILSTSGTRVGAVSNNTVSVGQTKNESWGGNIFVLPPAGERIFFVIQDRPSNTELARIELTPAILRGFSGTTYCDQVASHIEGPNTPPVANAGPDRTGTISTAGKPNFATFDASGSSDPDSDTLTYSWTQLSGPASAGSPSVTNPAEFHVTQPTTAGVQVWQLTVDDGRGSTSTDTVQLTWTGGAVNNPPVADAGAGQTLLADFSGGGTAQTATLDASGSSDPDGDALTYAWTQISGPATTEVTGRMALPGTLVAVAGASSSKTYTQPSTAGTVVYEVTVDDGNGGLAKDRVSVVWQSNAVPVNPAPTTQNPSGPVVVGSVVALTAGTPTDPNGSPVTVGWVQTGGPSVVLSDPTSSDPTFPAPGAGGTFTFQVTVSDGINETVKTVTTTLVIDQTPIADAGADQTLADVAPGTVVTLDGSASIDPDGGALTYQWTQISGPNVSLVNPTTSTPSFTFPEAQRVKELAKASGHSQAVSNAGQAVETIVFELVVSDGQLTSTPDQVTITINTNEVPVANAGDDQTLFGLGNGDTVSLDGSASSDPDGDTLSYAWSILSGTATLSNETTVTPTLTYTGSASDGNDDAVEIQLIVNDGAVDSVADTVSVNFRDNRAPTANAGSDQSQINAGETVTLSASNSSDPDGDSLTYLWSQVSGPTVTLSDETSENPTFTAPDVSGNTDLVFEVTVNDGKVDSTSDRVTIGVQPTGSITIIQQTSGGDSAFAFTSTVSDLNGTITTQGGTGQLVSTRVNSGTYTITAADKRDDGFALTDLTCSDADSTVNLSSRLATIVLSPGEDLTCTFSSVNSRGAAEKAIQEMLVQRNKLILSNQPDLTRRLNRLKGQTGSTGGVKVAGLQVASNEKIPLTAEVSETGGKLSSSLSQSRGKAAKTGKGSIDIWGEGTLAQFESVGKDGAFSIFYAGADYMVSDTILVGALVQFDDFETDSRNKIGDADGTGFMAGPYATAKLGKNIYLDGRVAWGASNNSINPLGNFVDDFDTNRLLITASLSGDVQLKETLNLRPTLAVRNISETQKSYVDSLGVSIGEQKVDQGEISFAPRLEKSVVLQNGWLFRPYGSVEGIVSFGDEVEGILENSLRARLEGGASWSSPSGFNAGISAFADGVGSDLYNAEGIRISLSYVMHNN